MRKDIILKPEGDRSRVDTDRHPMVPRWRHSVEPSLLFLQLTNILGTVFMMGGRVHTATPCWDGFSVGTGGKQIYFTPAPWSFLMWYVTLTSI